jgi:hypothetical protein
MRVVSSKVRRASCILLCRQSQWMHFLYVKRSFVPKTMKDDASVNPGHSIHTGWCNSLLLRNLTEIWPHSRSLLCEYFWCFLLVLRALVSFAPLELQGPYVKPLTIRDLVAGNQHTTVSKISQWTPTIAMNASKEGKTLNCLPSMLFPDCPCDMDIKYCLTLLNS